MLSHDCTSKQLACFTETQLYDHGMICDQSKLQRCDIMLNKMLKMLVRWLKYSNKALPQVNKLNETLSR